MYPVLYILMRTDMASLNPGKAMAQAAHAANAFEYHMGECGTAYDYEMVRGWAAWGEETDQGFGTTIVLEVFNGAVLEDVISDAMFSGFPARTVHDPEYPVRDGEVTHLVPVDTCGFVFTPCREEFPVEALEGLSLHR